MATILVVDDESIIRESTDALLSMVGDHSILTAATATEALSIAASRPPDLAILDWMLANDLDGLQLADALRCTNPTLPIILVTGYLADDLQARVDTLDGVWVLLKPCDFEDFVQTVQKALSPNEGAAGPG